MSVELIRWLIYLHVLSAIGFFFFHGASAAMAFQLRKEEDFGRIRALLDLSSWSMPGMLISFLVMSLDGIALAFLVRAWGHGYVWVSIGLMLGVAVYMGLFTEKHYVQLRRLVGLPYRKGNGTAPAETPASPQEVAALLKQTSIAGIAMAGFVVPVIVLWLMFFKPF